MILYSVISESDIFYTPPYIQPQCECRKGNDADVTPCITNPAELLKKYCSNDSNIAQTYPLYTFFSDI
ncbi:MAG: hypothetical protein FWG70_11955 [Oscillospiraceae bacterium]|nr:hypothetical protein [Oscillospiraceae bacterium]